jgi:hypothetical protein
MGDKRWVNFRAFHDPRVGLLVAIARATGVNLLVCVGGEVGVERVGVIGPRAVVDDAIGGGARHAGPWVTVEHSDAIGVVRSCAILGLGDRSARVTLRRRGHLGGSHGRGGVSLPMRLIGRTLAWATLHSTRASNHE